MRDWYRSHPTIHPSDGIRAQTQKGQFGKTWWAGRWIAALERLVDPARLTRGRSYARNGQVLTINIHAGRVDARVQGSRRQPYIVQIAIELLSAASWEKVADAMSAQAIFAAKLLAGDMPQDIEEAFTAAEATLFPASRGDLHTSCSCPDYANPCKHVAAVYYLLGEQFDVDPFLIFRLRGKAKDEIVAMLRARRSAPPAEGSSSAALQQPIAAPVVQEPDVPLQDCLDYYWEAAASLDETQIAIERPTVDAAPVKRLGQPGFWSGRASVIDLFAHHYHTVTGSSIDDLTATNVSEQPAQRA
jgi:uncharacterized Zn finger protein